MNLIEKTYNDNKSRIDLRKYTREFQKTLKNKFSKNEMYDTGNIYLISYNVDSSILTEKYHFTPLIVSFGRFKDEEKTYIRGINILFLEKAARLELLNDIYTCTRYKKDEQLRSLIAIHEKWNKAFPHLFINLEQRRILSGKLIEMKDWGMIPLVKSELFGSFHSSLLEKDFNKQYRTPDIKRKIKEKKKSKPHLAIDEEFEIENEVLETYHPNKVFDN